MSQRRRRWLCGLGLALAASIGPGPELVAGGRPVVSLGQINSSGPLAPAWVRHALQPLLPRFERCWQALPPDKRLGGHLQLRLEVPASPVRHRKVGARVSLVGRSIFDRQLADCVLGVARSITFAAAQRDSVIVAQLNFSAGGRAVPRPPARRETILAHGTLVDAANDRPVGGGTVLLLHPWVSATNLDPEQLERQVVAVAVSSSRGRFNISAARPRGFAYGVAILARGYEPVGADAAVRTGVAGLVDLGTIRLRRRRY
jgi:hypothetical protein